ncbi:MAG: hypothetical protein ACR2PG_22480 [Hyphomicrobiaceae bacterium]
MTQSSQIAFDRHARLLRRNHHFGWRNVNGLSLVIAALFATILITGVGEANFRAHDALIAKQETQVKVAHCPATLTPHTSLVR